VPVANEEDATVTLETEILYGTDIANKLVETSDVPVLVLPAREMDDA